MNDDLNDGLNDDVAQRLRERLLLGRAVPGDYLVLADATLQAALDGSRALTAGELAALQGSPLTLRRFRHLALARRLANRSAPAWRHSAGMLRAADSGGALDRLVTDDGWWQLHFLGAGPWQVILTLDAQAPCAAQLLRERPLLCVTDGTGATVLTGRLDGDGECEAAWPFEVAPTAHFQAHGAAFAVTVAPR